MNKMDSEVMFIQQYVVCT